MREYRISLTREEESDLARRMRNGDLQARERLIESIIPWVRKIASWFVKPGCDLDDLFSVGLLAALKCLDSFDPKRGRLTTWISRPVTWRCAKYARNAGAILSRPVNWPQNPEYREAWEHAHRLYHDVQYDLHEHEDQRSGADSLEQQELFEQLHVAIQRLSEREQFVVRERMKGQTLKSIASELEISKERVRQIENGAHDLIREQLNVQPD